MDDDPGDCCECWRCTIPDGFILISGASAQAVENLLSELTGPDGILRLPERFWNSVEIKFVSLNNG